MCGRYTDDAELSEIRLSFDVEAVELFRDWKPTYNITPSYGPGFEQLMVVRTREGKRALRLGRFWMIPPGWNKPLKELPTTFNARAEDVATKRWWKEAFTSHRCLIPATGWREFRAEAGKKQPYHFHLDRKLFAFAGVSSRTTTDDGEVVDSFAIITTAPSPQAAPIHDRMPLVLAPELYGSWLGGEDDPRRVLEQACSLALGLPLEVYPSDPIANSSRYEGPRALDAVTRDPSATGPLGAESAPLQGELFGNVSAKPRRA
ncbi:MAG TPA: SOS response-associated peptidase [Polyangiaceae bacterium]|nr:SOS response-associated peptidase [Polyangiaceae bacterium]